MTEKFISIREASRLSGYSVDHIRKLARDGTVPAEKVVNSYLVDIEALLDHKRKMELQRQSGPA